MDTVPGKSGCDRPAPAELTEVKSGKLSTRQGTLLAELVPTRKIIASLRDWFPKAHITGRFREYGVDGDKADDHSHRAKSKSRIGLTNACVANDGVWKRAFGLVTRSGACTQIWRTPTALFEALEKSVIRYLKLKLTTAASAAAQNSNFSNCRSPSFMGSQPMRMESDAEGEDAATDAIEMRE